jgi:hypothetical protein
MNESAAPKKRGRVKGSKGRAHVGSKAERVSTLQVGESLWVETTPGTLLQDMREWCFYVRKIRPLEILKFELTAQSFTAISTGKMGSPPVYLIRVTRSA